MYVGGIAATLVPAEIGDTVKIHIGLFDKPKDFNKCGKVIIDEYWNKKFIRAIQEITNATKGKIWRGRSFFEKAFGKNLEEFNDLLWMPEAMIIYRIKYESLAEERRKIFHSLNENEIDNAKRIIAQNKFSDTDISKAESENVRQFLKFYKVTRND